MHQNRFRFDNLMTATMIEDMIFDPILAAKVLLDVNIPPHQELRLLSMWTSHFTMDDSGFSTGKTFTAALCIALRSMLMPQRISGVLSGTFRQGKLVFQYFDRWYSSSKLFRSMIKHQQGRPRLVHGQEAFEAHWRGGSSCRVLPPNFLNDSLRLRGERWNDGYFDEWTTYGNYQTLTSTIFGRVTGANEFAGCPVRQNHAHCFSTPGYTHSPSYKLVERIESQIKKGNKDYVRFTSNYRHVPRTPKWKPLVDLKTIRLMQDTNPIGVIGSEIDGLWQSESKSYYSSMYIENARKELNITLSRVNTKDVYVLGFDTARGHQDSSRGASGDDFAATVIRDPRDGSSPYPCCNIRYSGITADQMSAIIHDLHRQFGFSMICYDTGGGGLFVADSLAKNTQTIRGVDTTVTPLLNFGDTSGAIGEQIMTPFIRTAYWINRLYGKMASDSVLINRMHSGLKTAIHSDGIYLPPTWKGVNSDIDYNDPDELRSHLNKTPAYTEIDRCRGNMHLMVQQLAFVDVKRNKENGDPFVDRYGMYQFTSKTKKDSAYSLAYGYMAYMIYKKMEEAGWLGREIGDGRNSFPVSMQEI